MEIVEGYVIRGFPFVFDGKMLAERAKFPSELEIKKYEEKEEEDNE